MKKNGCWRNFLYFFVLVVAQMFPLDGVTQTPKIVRVPPATSEYQEYCRGLLKLALSYSTTRYRFEDFADAFGGTERDLVQLEQGKLDVAWLPSSEYVETHARAVRVPIFRGLLGIRILLIHKDDQQRFDQVQTLNDLKAFTFGQGADWPDTTILKENRFRIITAQQYESLFLMLDGRRFDAFPRGVFEPWSELQSRSQLDLKVEEQIAISYKLPVYFFVGKHNASLAEEIEQGLYRAIDDGAFNEYFFKHSLISEAIDKANLHERKIFHIENSTLSPGTPLENKKLWWSPIQQAD